MGNISFKKKVKLLIYTLDTLKGVIISLLFAHLIPSVIWAAKERLNILIGGTGNIQCETLMPGVGKRQIGPKAVTAGDSVVLVVAASDASYNPYICTHKVRVSVLDEATLPHLRGGIREDRRWDTLQLVREPTTGYYGAFLRVVPYRATIHQRGVSAETTPYPKDILEYRFLVEDISPDPLLGDTSSPLDSVIPAGYERLLLVLPGERHFPGDIIPNGIGKRGLPIDWNVGTFYDCWVYATDRFYNAVPGTATLPESAYIVTCLSILTPDSIILPRNRLYYEDHVRKQVFKVRYPTRGYAGLIVFPIIPPPGGPPSLCGQFKVTGPSPDPKDMIVVIPNPCGTPGVPAQIIIKRVPIEGGQIRGKIFDSFGYLVRDFSEELLRQTKEDPLAISWVLQWDCRNDKGNKVANGCYHFCVEITQAEWGGVWKEKIGVVW